MSDQTNPPEEPPRYGQRTPENSHSAPGAPEQGNDTAAQESQYGQYGQYGQPSQQLPQYGQPSQQLPQYGQQAPQYGQPSQQVPQYGQYGQPNQQGFNYNPYGAPQPYLGQQQSSAKPKVVTAFIMWLIQGIFFLLLGLLCLIGAAFIPQLQQLSTQDPRVQAEINQALAEADMSMEEFIDVVPPIVFGVGIFFVILAAFFIGFAFPVLKGHNWARILITIFAAIFVLLFLIAGAWFLIVPSIVGIVMMYLPGVNAFFNRSTTGPAPLG